MRSAPSPPSAAAWRPTTAPPRTSNGRSSTRAPTPPNASSCCRAARKPSGPRGLRPLSPPRSPAPPTTSSPSSGSPRDRAHPAVSEPPGGGVVDLTNEDVADILAVLDSLPYDELDLQTPRFRLTLRRANGGWTEESQVLADPVAVTPARDGPPAAR